MRVTGSTNQTSMQDNDWSDTGRPPGVHHAAAPQLAQLLTYLNPGGTFNRPRKPINSQLESERIVDLDSRADALQRARRGYHLPGWRPAIALRRS